MLFGEQSEVEFGVELGKVLPGTEGIPCNHTNPRAFTFVHVSPDAKAVENMAIRYDGSLAKVALGPVACNGCPLKCVDAHVTMDEREFAVVGPQIGIFLGSETIRLSSSARIN